MHRAQSQKPSWTLALAVLALSSGVLSAHDGHDHGKAGAGKVMGTVTAVHADMNHVEIKDKDGKVGGFTVDAKTKYLRGKTSATLADIKVGERVVADVSGEGGKKLATTVKLSGDKARATGEKPSPSEKKPGTHGDH